MIVNQEKKLQRVGYYCWAGPGTIRIIKEKFFSPKIDETDLMNTYSYDYLSKIRDTFGVTDFWATYSWGFDQKTEQPDYEFLLDNVENFKKAGIKLHAYIQGPNVVYDCFREKDWYTKDHKNRLVSYYKGRKVTCLNNPEFVNHILGKIDSLKNSGIDGVFIDNIQNGQLGVPVSFNGVPIIFTGCNCNACQNLFTQKTGEKIPTDFETNPEITKKYLDFRVSSTSNFIETLAAATHRNSWEFGTNSFDPKYDTKLTFGTDMEALKKHQDYLLFETHALRDPESLNHLDEIVKGSAKPIFVISYRNGIGYDSELSQADINSIFSSAASNNSYPAIKGSEFVTNGVWHNLNPDKYSKPQIIIQPKSEKNSAKARITEIRTKFVRNFLKEMVNPAYELFMENRFIRQMFSWAYKNFI